MNKNKKESFFWTSYSDLMTSLFFVMLVLFVLTIALLHKRNKGLITKLEEYEHIESVKRAINEINPDYFEYRPEYKKHIFKLQVQYPRGEFEISTITNLQLLYEIENAGKDIVEKITNLKNDTVNRKLDIQYLVIIEGQASADNYGYNNGKYNDYYNNDVLSYQRALGLKKFWENKGIYLDRLPNCELVIAGSGEKGIPREEPNWRNEKNQRFLITIIPKTGIINNK